MELLDFIRATTPIAYPGSGTTPAAGWLQLSNDFEYISKALGESLPAEALGDAQNRNFKASATTIRQSFVQSQLGVISSLLMGTNRFADTSNEDTFAMAETSVAKLTAHVTNLGRDLTVSSPRLFLPPLTTRLYLNLSAGTPSLVLSWRKLQFRPWMTFWPWKISPKRSRKGSVGSSARLKH